jgi:hypothetical protein
MNETGSLVNFNKIITFHVEKEDKEVEGLGSERRKERKGRGNGKKR